MRSKTLEIRWHDTSPIFSSDFQPLPAHQLKKLLNVPGKDARDTQQLVAGGRSYRLATGGADNHVRLWLIHPNIPEASSSTGGPSSASTSHSAPQAAPPPRAEFLATLKRHTAAVNVVRWSPKEELLASAGDDGFVLLWVPKPASSDGSSAAMSASSSAFGDSAGAEEGQKENWRVKMMIRPTTNEIYDLAWSPDGAHFIVGCTDNTAKIYDAASGTCIKAIADHSHYVQGVAWDPLNEFIATQSSDRTVHIHRIHQNKGDLEFHPHNRSQKMDVHHSRTPSFSSSSSSTGTSRPAFLRRASTAASDTESVITSVASEHGDDNHSLLGASSSKDGGGPAPLTPTASNPGTPSLASLSSMKPPSRRSSFSSSVAASPPPPNFSGAFASLSSNGGPSRDASRYGRSPSPLPAIRPPPSSSTIHPSAAHPRSTSTRLYGDESYTHYFRRLSFSPDGALLLTPAGQIDDQHLSFPPASDEPGKAKKSAEGGSKPTVYIYSRANLHNSPIGHLPGQKTASVAVKFSPIFYELRDVAGDPGAPAEVKTIVVDEKSGEDIRVSLGTAATSPTPPASTRGSPTKARAISVSAPHPTHLAAPLLSATSSAGPSSLAPSVSPSPAPASVFGLPYRMFFAVATQDAVLLYDTQQTGPIAIFVGLHYAGFTDLAWSPDGQTLMLSSIDGYCSVVVFDSSELGTLHATQQHQKQLQAIAHNLSAPHPPSLPPSPALSHAAPTPAPTPIDAAPASAATPVAGEKRPASEAGGSPAAGPAVTTAASVGTGGVKKKRRIELQHTGGLD